MTDAPGPPTAEPPRLTVCYRHPDRAGGVGCQRCGRPICVQCMVPASVGYQCPECTHARPQKVVSGRAAFGGGGTDVVVGKVLVALNVVLYALTVVVATKRMSRAGMVAVGGVVRVPGSWVPLALLMGIFAVKFALGVAAGIRSPLLDDPAVVAAASASLGLLGGGFGARAMAVHGVARTAVGA